MYLRPKKSLGQHFLNSSHVLEQIIAASNIQIGETVLEIGPGTGVLTRALLDAGANVISVEKDDIAYEMVRDKFHPEMKMGKLKLIHGDVLDSNIFDFVSTIFNPKSQIANRMDSHLRGNDKKYALIANIPYYITGAILEKFLEYEPRPSRMVLLVQKEVAERIVARDGKESILSVSVKAFGVPKLVAKVPPGAFTPPPTVDSAILAISDISADQFKQKNVDISRFFEIVRAGFAHKRKFLIRNLEAVIPAETLGEIWQKNNLNYKVRAEDLKVEEWVEIAGSFPSPGEA